jgi:hypothetical protein
MTSADTHFISRPPEGAEMRRAIQKPGAGFPREMLESARIGDRLTLRSSASSEPFRPHRRGSYDRLNRSVFDGGDVGMKVSRKMRVESLYCIFIRRGAPEADETVRADQNNAALP